ncbi:MAG TPA: putative 2-aminoethylphosphonate ABC transporter ATP-binding protein [Rhabdaerophilum sp.]|nr:putative 2-aminoethylphosphonate ABC transporter ATP-binding protein [Rhabdaerophilum sp.]
MTGSQTKTEEAADAPFVSIRSLDKFYGTFKALADINLDVARGEFVSFLGPSGCGKTTLLRAIAGLDRQSSGTISIGGRDVSQAPPSERDFGIVFQSYALFPNLTIAENIGYGLVNRRRPKTEITARVQELLDMVGLPGQANKYPAQLSGGQQQRVALARALATSPGLLLLDEPLSALDAQVRIRLREEIRDVQKRLGVTTFMVTHDQEEALSMADRIVVMNHGVIEQIGTPEEIYRTPRTPFVADFIGRINLLPGVLRENGQVEFADRIFACSAGPGLAPGAKVEVGVRPEAIRVRGVFGSEGNAVRVRIHDLEFLGAFCRAMLEVETRPDLHLVADFSANLMHDLALAEGMVIPVELPAEALRLFPARPSA